MQREGVLVNGTASAKACLCVMNPVMHIGHGLQAAIENVLHDLAENRRDADWTVVGERGRVTLLEEGAEKENEQLVWNGIERPEERNRPMKHSNQRNAAMSERRHW